MPIKLGAKNVSQLYLGSSRVAAAYLGSLRIWPVGSGSDMATGDSYLSARVVFLTPDKPSATVYALKPGATNSMWANLGIAGSTWLSGEADRAKSVTFTATSFPASGQTVAVAEYTYDYEGGSAVCEVMVIAAASSTVPSITTNPTEAVYLTTYGPYGPTYADFTAHGVDCGDLRTAVFDYDSALYTSYVEKVEFALSTEEPLYNGRVSVSRAYGVETRFYLAIYGTRGGCALLYCHAGALFDPPHMPSDPEEDPGEDETTTKPDLGKYFRFLDDSLRIDYGEGSHPVRFTIDEVPPVFMGDGDVDDAAAKKAFIESIEFSVEYEEDAPADWLSVRTEAVAKDFNFWDAGADEVGSVILSRKLIFVDASRNVNGEDGSAPFRKATVYARYYETQKNEETGLNEKVLIAKDSVVIEQVMLWGLVFAKAVTRMDSNLCGGVGYPLEKYDPAMMLVVNQRGTNMLSADYMFPPYLSGDIELPADSRQEVFDYYEFNGETFSPYYTTARDTREFPLYGAAGSIPSSEGASFFVRSYDEGLETGGLLQCERGKLYYLLFPLRYETFIWNNASGESVLESRTVYYDRAFVPLDLIAGRKESAVATEDGTEYTVYGIIVLRGFKGVRIECYNCIVDGVYYDLATGGTVVAGDLFVAYNPVDSGIAGGYLILFASDGTRQVNILNGGIVSFYDRRTFTEIDEANGYDEATYRTYSFEAWIPNRSRFFETRTYLPNATDPATLPDTVLAERIEPDDDEETDPDTPKILSRGMIPFGAKCWRDAEFVGTLPPWITSWTMTTRSSYYDNAGDPFGYNAYYSGTEAIPVSGVAFPKPNYSSTVVLVLFGVSGGSYSENSGENSTLITVKIYFDKELGVFDYTSVNYMLPAKEEDSE